MPRSMGNPYGKKSGSTPSPQPVPQPPVNRQANSNFGKTTPQRTVSTTPIRKSGGGGQQSSTNPYGGGGPSLYSGGGGPVGDMGSINVEPAIPSEEDYLAGDSSYQATLSALARQLQGFRADVDSQRSSRKLDYDKSLKDLGYRASEGGPSSWNWDDVLTASGRAYQNNSNDFASRGMLQSQAYADSINNLQRSLMDQYNGIDQTNTQFNTDLDRQLTKAQEENTSATQQARAEAILRRAAQYGFGV